MPIKTNIMIKNAISNIRINTILSVIVLTIGMILMPNKAVAQPPPPLLPPCDLDCEPGVWESRCDTIDPGEDGGCKIIYKYKIKKCEDSAIIQEIPPMEFIDCNPDGPFPNGNVPYEMLMVYVIKAYRIVSNNIANELIAESGKPCVYIMTSSYGYCFAVCEIPLQSYTIQGDTNSPIKTSTMYYFKDCEGAQGCCIHIRKYCIQDDSTMTISEYPQSSPNSGCPGATPPQTECQELIDRLDAANANPNSAIFRKYKSGSIGPPIPGTCNSHCDW